MICNPEWRIDRSGFIFPPDDVRAGRLVFGLAVYQTKVIYLPWLPQLIRLPRDMHEYGHTWGVTSCLNKDSSCLMYEGGDDLAEKLTSWPDILLRRLETRKWFCEKCLEILTSKGAFEK